MRSLCCFLMIAVLSACQTTKPVPVKKTPPGEVADEVSLRDDRESLAAMRTEEPEEIRKSNDEVALILNLMKPGGDSDEEPGKIRDRFNKALRDRRDKQDRILRKKREDFSAKERSDRELFLKRAQSDRDSFTHRKSTSNERKEFFDDQDVRRRDYFARAADKRKDFESRVDDERKTFEDYVREKTNQFNQTASAYTTEYYDRRKNESLKKRMQDKTRENEKAAAQSQNKKVNDEFNSIPNTPATPLVPPTDN